MTHNVFCLVSMHAWSHRWPINTPLQFTQCLRQLYRLFMSVSIIQNIYVWITSQIYILLISSLQNFPYLVSETVKTMVYLSSHVTKSATNSLLCPGQRLKWVTCQIWTSYVKTCDQWAITHTQTPRHTNQIIIICDKKSWLPNKSQNLIYI